MPHTQEKPQAHRMAERLTSLDELGFPEREFMANELRRLQAENERLGSRTGVDHQDQPAVLAGLRALQHAMETGSADRYQDILTNAGAQEAPGPQAIQELIDRVQSNTSPVRVVVEMSGGCIVDAFGDRPFEMVLIDADIEGGDPDRIVCLWGTEYYLSRMGGAGCDESSLDEVDTVFAICASQDEMENDADVTASSPGVERPC